MSLFKKDKRAQAKSATKETAKDTEKPLHYTGEDDRAYGLAGMAIAAAAIGALDRVAEVNLDAEGPMVEFSHEFYFTSSPSISPKVVWQRTVENFKITSMMVMANVMSRYYIRLSQPLSPDILSLLQDAMTEEGSLSCSLEADEVNHFFSSAMRDCHRIFSNPRLSPRVTEFAGTLGRRRHMTALEVADELRRLQLI